MSACANDVVGDAPGWYLVCEYYPGGNVIGQFRENVQEPVRGQTGGALRLKVGGGVVWGVVGVAAWSLIW